MPRSKKVKENINEEYYFGAVEEQAVIDYSSAKSVEVRSKIYNQHLAIPLKKMVSSILRRYPIHIGNYDIFELEADALSHVVTQMGKFNPDKPTKMGGKPKAYSYLGTIIRNYFKTHSDKSRKEILRTVDYDGMVDTIEEREDFIYRIDNDDIDVSEKFFMLFKKIFESIEKEIVSNKNLKHNDIIVGRSVVNILQNWEMIFEEEVKPGEKLTNNYTKNKILYYIKEDTKLSTKEIRTSIKQFTKLYKKSKNEFNK